MLTELSWLLVALPLLGAAVLLLGGRLTDSFGPLLATALSWGSFAVGAAIFVGMLGTDAHDRSGRLELWDWVPAGNIDVTAGLVVDPLSLAFVLLITFVGSLIHVYSLGYMEHDPDKRRFFAYLNLFVASMLVLVLADSYLLLFVGWEGVGLASWLLIGFWNHNPAYATAANKAFIANRIGDVGLILAMSIMLATFGTVDFAAVDAAVGGKTGVNTPEGKNLVGAFHQPSLVLADIAVLDTLSPRDFLAGYGEVVKYGLIDDPAFFAWCEANGAALLAGDADARAHAIAHAVAEAIVASGLLPPGAIMSGEIRFEGIRLDAASPVTANFR